MGRIGEGGSQRRGPGRHQRSRAQVQGQKMQELSPDHPALFPAGVPHWHGAEPDQGLVQIAVNVGTARWMAPVSDDEYLGRK